MTSSTFKSHFNMISLHEPVQHKARFWSSYIRALKGTENMVANDRYSRARSLNPASQSADIADAAFPRIFDDFPLTPYSHEAGTRINMPGYKYMPVSRETYGSQPRLSARQVKAAPSTNYPSRNRH